jgi:hypothetical protein
VRRLPLVALALLFVLVPIGAHATASGPVGPIVYVSGGNLAVASSSGSPIATNGPAGSSPTWSPASQKIAYISGIGAGTTIRTVTWDGSSFGAPSGALVSVANLDSVAWSPNGGRLAYADGTDVFVINADGSGSATNLTNSGGASNQDPAWAPDGSEIAFASDRDGSFDIYRMSSTDGSNQTKLTSSGGDDTKPTWSPDGSTIAFTSDRDSIAQIYKVPAAGGNEVRLTNENAADSDPSYSPVGDKIVLVHSGDLATMNATGGAVTEFSGPVAGTEPEWGLTFGPLSPPTVSPTFALTEGSVVTASTGTWSATPSSFTYQWQRCNSAGASCNPISGATSSTYTVSSSDNGSTLRVAVTATASGGSGTSTSAATSLIQQATSVPGLAPTIVDVPTIFVTPPSGQTQPEGKVLIGSFFSTGLGTWRGEFPLTYTYQWKKCDDKDNCYTIPGATASTFVPGAELFDWKIAATVIAKNAIGITESTSKTSGKLTALAPRGTVTPPVTGSNVVGETLSVATGTFTGTAPFAYSYVWRRCDAQGTLPSCVAIPGATSASYVLQQADLGAALRAYVTATNVIGADTLITNHTFPTLPKPKFAPTATAAPAMLGNPLPGLALTATLGTWSGDAPIKLTIQWQRCDATGGGCVAIKGATKRTLNVTTKYAGSRLRFVVTASNGVGTVSTTGPVTDAIQLIPHRKGRTIRGTRNADYLAGSGFDDTIYGLGGNDTIVGGAGADRILGGAGADVITGGTGRDRIDAGAGSDTIMAADGDRDTVDCGAGSDRAVVDAIDVTVNCEAVQIAGGTTPLPPPVTTTTPTTTGR